MDVPTPHIICLQVGRMDGVVVNVKPEYEDCKGAAMALGLPLRAVLDEANRAARGHIAGGGEGAYPQGEREEGDASTGGGQEQEQGEEGDDKAPEATRA